MPCLFLTLLLVTTVYTLKTHERYEVCKRLLTGVKKEKGIMPEPALMNADICKDCQHRMRREADIIQNLFYKTPKSRPKQVENNIMQAKYKSLLSKIQNFLLKTPKSRPKQAENIQFQTKDRPSWNSKSFIAIKTKHKPSWNNHQNTNHHQSKSFIEIKTRRKREYPPWPEWRKLQRSKDMKEYWKYQIQENTTRIINQRQQKKAYWARMSDKGGDRRKEYSDYMKAFWKDKYKQGLVNRTAYSQGQRKIMEEYWTKEREGSTKRLKRMSQHLKEFWKGYKKTGNFVKYQNEKRVQTQNRTNLSSPVV
uniref:Uncharacterized protein n=1 Tax=Cacopsylla melanoneura TaxID=428564 RepID=A0A8D8QGS9_9HEMI